MILKNTLILMHMDDNAFKDECGYTIQNAGGVILDTTNKVFGNGSAKFNGGNCLNINYTNTNYKTIDFRFKFSSASQQFNFLFTFASTCWGLYITTSHKLSTWSGYSGVIGNTVLSPNIWYHCAMTFDTTAKIYLNGNLEITASLPSFSSGILKLMGWTDNTNWLTPGWIDEFRVCNIVKWANNFVPPTSPYTLFSYLIQDGSNIDNSSDGIMLAQTNNLPYTVNEFNNYGMNCLNNITPTVISKIVNEKYNVGMLK